MQKSLSANGERCTKPMCKVPIEKLQKVAPKVKDKDFEDFVLKACEHYYRYLQRQRNRDARWWILKYIGILKAYIRYLDDDIRGEYSFKVKDHEVVATFAEKPNTDILPRLREILLGDSHIRQSDAPDIKLKKNIKEAV